VALQEKPKKPAVFLQAFCKNAWGSLEQRFSNKGSAPGQPARNPGVLIRAKAP
jgi:hypothetical protein